MALAALSLAHILIDRRSYMLLLHRCTELVQKINQAFTRFLKTMPFTTERDSLEIFSCPGY